MSNHDIFGESNKQRSRQHFQNEINKKCAKKLQPNYFHL